MITEIHLRDFRIHRDTLLEGLGPLVAIVGPNASGKTNLLRAVSQAGEYVKTGKVTPSFPKGATIEIAVASDHKPNGFVLSSNSAQLPPIAELARVPNRFLRLDGDQIGAVSIMLETPPRMAVDGWGLASCLSYLLTTNRTMVDDLLHTALQIIPALRGAPEPQVPRVKLREAADGRAVAEIRRNGYRNLPGEVSGLAANDTIGADQLWLAGRPADQASEGTLICLAILTELIMTEGTVLIDDIDHGLHPAAQRALITALRQLVGQKPNAQVIMTPTLPTSSIN
jgi:energy-coupling factor transporter ATP-binding protein EcfA2